jgi:Fe-S oxidoreductase
VDLQVDTNILEERNFSTFSNKDEGSKTERTIQDELLRCCGGGGGGGKSIKLLYFISKKNFYQI